MVILGLRHVMKFVFTHYVSLYFLTFSMVDCFSVIVFREQ